MSPRSLRRQTTRYAFDESNRLVVTTLDPGARRTLRREVIVGSLATDTRNRLLFRPFRPQDTESGSRQITLDGAWQLTQDHRLLLRLAGAEGQGRERLVLNGALAAADETSLTLALEAIDARGRPTRHDLALTGRWQADSRNRLTFMAQKSGRGEDRLTLSGAWAVGERHELSYAYTRRDRSRGATSTRVLRFEGGWDIATAGRLVYRLDTEERSVFSFRAAIQTPSLVARSGRIAYQIGIRVARERTVQRRVVLFGAWKLHRDFSLSFELPHADGKREAVRLGASLRWRKKNEAVVELRGRDGRRLGFALRFNRALGPNSELFLRAEKDRERAEAFGGIHARF